MSLPLDRADAMAIVVAASDELRSARAASGVRQFAELLDGLCALYRIKLTTCELGEVATLQAAHKQCHLLRATLADGGVPPVL